MSSLLSMAPQKATIAETGEVVNVEDVKLNTVVAVKSGDMIPVDGLVMDGTCEVDEKTLTGESYPDPKQKDSIVWAGTVNVNGYISVKTTALAEDSAVVELLWHAAVALISLGVVPILLKAHNLRHWFYLALVVLVSAWACAN
ncbi:putative inactive cadmium/zinc-transporting ATPase HMA3 [Silene latifolia]